MYERLCTFGDTANSKQRRYCSQLGWIKMKVEMNYKTTQQTISKVRVQAFTISKGRVQAFTISKGWVQAFTEREGG